MLLLQIKDYIEANHEVSLSHLAKHFNIPVSAMQDMVYQWVKKGKVAIVQKNKETCSTTEKSSQVACSGQCGGCAQTIKETNLSEVWYQWL
ncbi:FeoC-like transcriptional regulator [Neisseria sp. Ec49-e6-T10]|uniref:FeoC-like transcriptional regulator n=1 Tax=Neisseria sp. Ec49-e6-T10 TaxID=3140744 RepID=UPI003EBDCB07